MFKRLLSGGAIALAFLVPVETTNADVLNQRDTQNVGTVTALPDFGTPGQGERARTVNVLANEQINDISVTIEGLNHTWAGDLVATLRRVDAAGNIFNEVDLFRRISRANGPVDPVSGLPTGAGNSSNLNGNYTFTSITNASNPTSIWSEADSLDNTQTIDPSQAAQLTAATFAEASQNAYFASNGNEAPVSLANAFSGQSTQGLWQVSLEDRNGQEVGSFTGVTLNFSSTAFAVPEPSSLSLLASITVGFFSLRRRKKTI